MTRPPASQKNELAYFRARWYDPATGTWLSADPESYRAGSSNLYACFNGDPVNNVDPSGNEPVTLAAAAAAAIAYLGHVALQTGFDVALDWARHEGEDWWYGRDTDFDWHASLQENFTVNLVSAGFGAKLKKLMLLKRLTPFGGKVARKGAEYAFDVGATGTYDMLVHDQSVAEAYGTAAIGGAIGRGAGHAIRGLSRIQLYHGTSSLNMRGIDADGVLVRSDDVTNDFGRGAYFGDLEGAKNAARSRTRLEGRPAMATATVRMRDLGRVLDLREGTPDAMRWERFLATESELPGVSFRDLYVSKATGTRGDLFAHFLRTEGYSGKFDAVIGPGYIPFGGQYQVAIKNPAIAKRLRLDWLMGN